jgi:hypothetical protein
MFAGEILEYFKNDRFLFLCNIVIYQTEIIILLHLIKSLLYNILY